MASAVSVRYLAKVSSCSCLIAPFQILISDFPQGKYTHACNCKQNFPQTGSLSGDRTLRENLKPESNPATPGGWEEDFWREPGDRTHSTVHNPSRLPAAVTERKPNCLIVSSVLQLSETKTELYWTLPLIGPQDLDCEWKWEEIWNLKKRYASVFLFHWL